MNPLILDVLIVAIIALFAFLGWRKGLVLTLCGLLAVFVAFAAAAFVSDRFSGSVAGILQPAIHNQIEQALNALHSLPQQTSPEEASLNQVMEALSRSQLFSGLQEAVTDAIHDGLVKVTSTAAAAIASYLALQLARAGLFFLTFFLVLLVWTLLSHALDLACRLPVLHTFNEAGGLIIGLIKGGLIALAVAWLLSTAGFAPPEAVDQTVLFQNLLNFQLL